MQRPHLERKCTSPVSTGLLTLLGRSTSGNVMMMTALGVVPLLAMIGGAVDASRVYMSYTRMQQACDAGALAGRKAMAAITTLSATEQAKANEFFDFNFPADTYSAQGIQRTFAKGADGVVVGNASATLPTTIMKIFGFTTVPIHVSCQATLNIPNTDIMFVLDVTGSMAEKAVSTDSLTKTQALKQATKDFFAALGAGNASGAGRVRYGFMPYSSNVNVGRLLLMLNRNYVVGGNGSETWTYQSREAETEIDHYISAYGTESAIVEGPPATTTWNNKWANVSGASYNGYATEVSSTSSACASTTAPATEWSSNSGSYTKVAERTVSYPDTTQTIDYTASSASGTATRYAYAWAGNKCRLRSDDGKFSSSRPGTTERSVTWSDRDKFKNWVYKQRNIDVSEAVANGTMPNPAVWTGYYTGTDPNYDTSNPKALVQSPTRWDGCIEEASTVNTITSTSPLSVPAGANDLDIDLIPNSLETRWKPYLRSVQFDRNGKWLGRNSGWISADYAACPTEARALTQYSSDYDPTTKSSASFTSYVDGLSPGGYTYHDIGLIWGARFLSPDGIYGTTNSDAAAPGGYQVSRHIVFMTDGTLNTPSNNNDPWGINPIDARLAPAGTANTNAVHDRRTQIICNAMKGKGFTVWVIGFSTTLNSTLQGCATDAAHRSTAANSTQLRQTFAQIARTIGGLRLSS